MVVAASPFGLSRVALDRRLNTQIPRKRAAHIPHLIRHTGHIAKPTARPRPKITSHKRLRKRDLQYVPEVRPEKRGTDRTRIADQTCLSQLSARRILASRTHPEDASVTQYKVQWETTWEDSMKVTGLAAEEWKEALNNGDTFEFRTQGGDDWTVLKDSTCLENDSEESQWEMWRAIRRNAVQEIEKDWFAGLKDGDFVFVDEAATMDLRNTLGDGWHDEQVTTKNILRTAWQAVHQNPELLSTNIAFGNIRLQFIAQLDPWMAEDTKEAGTSKRPSLTVADIIRALVPNPLESLEENTFSKENANNSYQHWREVVQSLIQKAPFLFKSGTWTQLFSFLILGTQTLETELASNGIVVLEDWCQRAREYDMHMYYERIVDNRSTHDIQETFLNLRDYFRGVAADSAIAEATVSSARSGCTESTQDT